jgi:L-alanine-DL-glutamate epimerase-like enolase superfamily enzyme
MTAAASSASESGLTAVKMKIGTDPESDLKRVLAARDAIGDDVDLFVDANGAYERKQALLFAEQLAEVGVTWFEDPSPATTSPAYDYFATMRPGASESSLANTDTRRRTSTKCWPQTPLTSSKRTLPAAGE